MIWKFSSRSSRLNPLRHAVIIQTQFTVSLCNIIISISAIILWFSRYVYVIYSYKYSYKYFFYFLSAEKTQSPDSTPCESVTDTKNEKPTGIWLLKFSNYVRMNALLLCFLWFDSGKYIFVSISQTYRQTYTCRTLLRFEEAFSSLFVHNYFKKNLEVYILVNKVYNYILHTLNHICWKVDRSTTCKL